MRLWYSGITSALQAEEAGSIPVGRLQSSLAQPGFFFERWNMGVRGEVFSSRLVTGDRTYFFNVKENVYGDLFLNIVESKGVEGGTEKFIRQSIVVYQEDIGEFIKEFQKSLDFIKQAKPKKS